MKRFFPLLLILLACLTLFAACALIETDDPATEAGTVPGTEPVETTAAGTGPFDVTFSVGGNETKVTVEAGEVPEFTGETSWETSEHFYKIIGWEPEIAPANGDVTYTAVVGEYGLTLYDVRFNMPDGLIKVLVHEGEMPTPPEGYDAPHLTVERVGTFTGWSPELTAPTAENMAGGKRMVYNPVYTYETRYYSITFKIGDAEYPVSVAGNVTPECPVTPEAPAGSNKVFVQWDHQVVPATADAVYVAQFMDAASVGTFNVATWNIGHYSMGNHKNTDLSDSQYDTESAKYRAYIESLDADLLCLNEYSELFTPSHPSREALFRETPAVYLEGRQSRYSCNAVYSSLPLQNLKVNEFTCNQTAVITHTNAIKATDYYYITGEMTVGNKTVYFVFTHLAFDDNTAKVCTDQMDELIAKYADKPYVVMMGDWNAYYQENFDAFVTAGYTLGNDGSVLTCTGSRTGGLEWPVDNIIVKGLTMRNFRAIQTTLSDHVAVVATLSLK